MSLVRANPGIAALVAIGGVVRATAMIAYRPAFLFFGDSYAYLSEAALPLPGAYRPSGYSLFLRAVLGGGAGLEPSASLDLGGLTTVALIQHAMGLALGVLVYVLMRRLEAPTWLAALAAAPVLLDAFQIDIEHYVMAEALFEVLVVGALLLLVWRPRPRPPVALAVGALLAGATVSRTAGLLLIIPAILYALVRRHGARNVVALAVGFAVPLVMYGAWFQAVHGTFSLSAWDGWFLYARTGPIARCDHLDLSPELRPLCQEVPANLRNPNYFIWNRNTVAARFEPPPGMEKNDMLRAFAIEVIRQQPEDYLRVAAGDVLHVFAPGRPVTPRDWPPFVWQFHPTSFPDLRGGFSSFLDGETIVRPLAAMLARYQTVVHTPGPFLALCVSLGVAGALLPGRRARPGRAEAFLLLSSGIAVLALPPMTGVFDYRYVLPALPLLPAAGALGALAILDRLRVPTREDRVEETAPRVAVTNDA